MGTAIGIVAAIAAVILIARWIVLDERKFAAYVKQTEQWEREAEEKRVQEMKTEKPCRRATEAQIRRLAADINRLYETGATGRQQ